MLRMSTPYQRQRIQRFRQMKDIVNSQRNESPAIQPEIKVDQVSFRPLNEDICSLFHSENFEKVTDATSSNNFLSVKANACNLETRVSSSQKKRRHKAPDSDNS